MTGQIQKIADDVIHRAHMLVSDGGAIGICEHTDDISVNDIYVARGAGTRYIGQALAMGAVLVVCDAQESACLACDNVIAVSDFESVIRCLVQIIYRDEISSVKLIGITGTNGKTSVACIVSDLLNGLGTRTGYIGTLGYGVVGESLQVGRNTTPDVITLYRNIAGLKRRGCEYIALEVSSHGIAMQRIYGLCFEVGVFTNFSHDHIDFHGSMENYRAVKESLFSDYEMHGLVVNVADPVGDSIYQSWVENDHSDITAVRSGSSKQRYLNVLSYSFAGVATDGKSQLEILFEGKSRQVTIPLAGRFNLENVMLALAVCQRLGFILDNIITRLSRLNVVPGRMERHLIKDGLSVYIDYAHTPASVAAVLSDDTVRSSHNWVILGCGGDRDKGKRPLMAAAAIRYCDKAIFCDDNVRADSAVEILLDMLSGIQDKRNIVICRDRRRAIEYALGKACINSSIFLLGKGDELLIRYGDINIRQCDRDVVQVSGRAA